MKKDIIIPKVKNVYIAAIPEWNEDFQEKNWYAYLINDSEYNLEMPIVVTRAYGTKDGQSVKTSTFRHAFKNIEANSAIKIELLAEEVLGLSNEFAVTYFLNNQLFDKTFTFQANTINEKALCDIPVIEKKGCLLK